MKKTLALILAIVMMAALAVPAFAEMSEDEGVLASDTLKGTGNKTCDVTYGVAQSYTVSLPTAINFAYTENDQVATLSVSNLVINGSNKLVISMDSGNDTTPVGGWEMRDVSAGGKSTAVPYTVTKEAPEVNNGAHVTLDLTEQGKVVANADTAKSAAPSVILEVKSNVDGLGGGLKLRFETEGTSQAGEYKDQITFNVAIVAIPTP